jgi:hypothetical protein
VQPWTEVGRPARQASWWASAAGARSITVVNRVRKPLGRLPSLVDADSLAKLKELSAESGVPYQRLLKERLAKADTVHSRLDRLEKELARVKNTLAA